jgi:hypothetical protein
MTLLPQDLEAALPPLYSTDEIPAPEKTVVAKFFLPAGRATWYVFEGEREGADVTFFGHVVSPLGPDCDELGYFSLKELESLEVSGFRVERDLYFKPTKFKDLLPGAA